MGGKGEMGNCESHKKQDETLQENRQSLRNR